ncbi:hypothetical protein [Kineococcus gypseus]|uniref:hypothetical protein n=1 Tax=Kineococcus gypseus TaxID=1637102 RepID=UPI003D7C6DD7
MREDTLEDFPGDSTGDSASEQDLRRRLRQQAGTFDGSNALIARSVHGGRRRLRRRRAAGAAGSVALLGAVLLAGAQLPGNGEAVSTVAAPGGSDTTPSTSATTAPSPAATPASTPAGTPTPLTAQERARQEQAARDEARAAELAVDVNTALAAALPGWPAATGGTSGDEHGAQTGWNFRAVDERAATSEALLVDLSLSVTRPSEGLNASSFTCEGADWVACSQRTLADGTLLRSGQARTTAESDEAPTITAVLPWALAVLPDGRIVHAWAGLRATPGAESGGERTLPASSALSVEALEQLVTSPELAQVPLP